MDTAFGKLCEVSGVAVGSNEAACILPMRLDVSSHLINITSNEFWSNRFPSYEDI